MSQRLVRVCLLLLGGCSLFLVICTSNAIADRYQDIENEANIRSAKNLPSGWINSISTESIIIDDTSYRYTDDTRFSSAKRKFIEGVFVEFEIKKENILANIGIAEPQEKDMYMKPIVRSDAKPVNKEVSKPQAAPHLENGVWVN